MKPFYFGSSQQPLFGVYHAAAGPAARAGGIVICQPFGSEYIRAHRSLRELAQRLADAGLSVMRFDYYGCGDSGGGSDEGHVERWLEDIALAIAEVREASGASKLSLVGLRLGATLAALLAARNGDVERLVLWEPVMNGEEYLAELAKRHRDFFDGRPKPRGLVESSPPDELLGFPVSPSLRESIGRLDLLRLTRAPAPRILLLSSVSEAAHPLLARLEQLGTAADYEKLTGARVWVREGELNQAVVPQPVLQRIASWFGEPRP